MERGITMENNGMVYFAVCPSTCEIWEDTDFRRLYNAVRRDFKSRIHNGVMYEYLSAVICYGAVIEKQDGYFRRMHYAFRDICRITVSGICGIIGTNEVERLGV